MVHPLFELLQQRPTAAETSLPGKSHLTDGVQDGKRGGDGGAGDVEPIAIPWQVAHGVSILAIVDPPRPGAPHGTPGVAAFAPGVTLAERREIRFDIEFFDVRVRRRAGTKETIDD